MEPRASLVAQLGENLPAVQETWVRFQGWEDPLEKEMATHSSILAWEIPQTKERSLMGYSLRHHKELDTTERLNHHQARSKKYRECNMTEKTLKYYYNFQNSKVTKLHKLKKSS